MTTQKHLKARVRSRMQKTGESYAAARAHVVAAGESEPAVAATPARPHVAGIHPETTALRILLNHADGGHEGPISEEAALAMGGGLGAGVFAFHYAKEAFSSLFLAGRSDWQDGPAFMTGAIRRLGLDAAVTETGSTRAADRDLRAALEHGPVAAWVDAAELGYRGLPPEHAGGSYHVLVVYRIDGDTAVVGDLAPEPIELPLADLARSRARIRAHKHRLLSVAAASNRSGTTDVAGAMRHGLRDGAQSLAAEARRNFSLAAFADLARRMDATSGADSWSRVFPRGRLLWLGLSSLHRFVATYSTGGGLMRPFGARAIAELADRTSNKALGDVAGRYAALGRAWSDLATAALPEDVPLLAETRRVQDAIASAFAARGPAATAELRAGWMRLAEIEGEADRAFPLDEAAVTALRADLAARTRAIHAAEVDALDALRAALAD
jgi:hypothetical protein